MKNVDFCILGEDANRLLQFLVDNEIKTYEYCPDRIIFNGPRGLRYFLLKDDPKLSFTHVISESEMLLVLYFLQFTSYFNVKSSIE